MSTSTDPDSPGEYGVQRDDGTYVRKSKAEIRNDVLSIAEQKLPEFDLREGTPMRQVLEVVIGEHDRIQKLLEQTHYQGYYETAWEQGLDRLLSLALFPRLERRGATGTVTFSTDVPLDRDVRIKAGTRVRSSGGGSTPSVPFIVTTPATLSAGSIAVRGVPIRAATPAECELPPGQLGDDTNVDAGGIDTIETKIGGITGVNNPEPTLGGRDREEDHEYRARYERSRGEAGVSTLDGIRSSVNAMPHVRQAKIEENDTETDNTGSGGLPPKSFRITANGEQSLITRDVAETIVDTKPAGIQAYGANTFTVETEAGYPVDIGFDLATTVDTEVNVSLTVTNNYPDNGNLRVENAVIDYIGGEKQSGETVPGLNMGEDVLFDVLRQRAGDIQGMVEIDVELGPAGGTLDSTTLTIADKEVAEASSDTVSVTHTLQ